MSEKMTAKNTVIYGRRKLTPFFAGILLPILYFVIVFSVTYILNTDLFENTINPSPSPPESTLTKKIESISKVLADTSREIALLQIELEARIEFVERLNEEAEIAESMKAASEAQIEAFRKMLNAEISDSSEKNF
jgi:hypothetical protein